MSIARQLLEAAIDLEDCANQMWKISSCTMLSFGIRYQAATIAQSFSELAAQKRSLAMFCDEAEPALTGDRG